MSNKTELTCTACPVGCRLTVVNEDGRLAVSGILCPRGERFGIAELTNPMRAVSTLVKVKGGERPVVSVRTSTLVPKKDITIVLTVAKQVLVSAPVHEGDVIVENIIPDVNLIATIDCGLKHQ